MDLSGRLLHQRARVHDKIEQDSQFGLDSFDVLANVMQHAFVNQLVEQDFPEPGEGKLGRQNFADRLAQALAVDVDIAADPPILLIALGRNLFLHHRVQRRPRFRFGDLRPCQDTVKQVIVNTFDGTVAARSVFDHEQFFRADEFPKAMLRIVLRHEFHQVDQEFVAGIGQVHARQVEVQRNVVRPLLGNGQRGALDEIGPHAQGVDPEIAGVEGHHLGNVRQLGQ